MKLKNTVQDPVLSYAVDSAEHTLNNKKLWYSAWVRDKALYDMNSRLRNARDEGIAIGQEKGIAIGQERGIAIGRGEGIAIGKSDGEATVLRNLFALKFSDELPINWFVEHPLSIELTEKYLQVIMNSQTSEQCLAELKALESCGQLDCSE